MFIVVVVSSSSSSSSSSAPSSNVTSRAPQCTKHVRTAHSLGAFRTSIRIPRYFDSSCFLVVASSSSLFFSCLFSVSSSPNTSRAHLASSNSRSATCAFSGAHLFVQHIVLVDRDDNASSDLPPADDDVLETSSSSSWSSRSSLPSSFPQQRDIDGDDEERRIVVVVVATTTTVANRRKGRLSLSLSLATLLLRPRDDDDDAERSTKKSGGHVDRIWMKTLINKRRSLCENRTILDIKYYGDMTGFMKIEICIQVLLLLRATRTRKKVVVTCTHIHTTEEDVY